MKKSAASRHHEITLNIKVIPRSSKSGIAGPWGDGIKVRLTSPPVEGKANKELIEVLAREFGIPKSSVQIIRGKSEKNKVVKLTGAIRTRLTE